MLKNKKNVLATIVFFLGALFFLGCQEEQSIVSPDNFSTGLLKYSLPANATFVSASLNIYISAPNNHPVNLHRITAPWDETTVTWGNFGGSYSPTAEPNSFTADAAGYKSVDVSSLVLSWIDGTYMDYGLLLDQADPDNYPWAIYNSKENVANTPPFLRIYYSTNGGNPVYVDVPAVADAYIWQRYQDRNYNNDRLYTGWDTPNSSREKQTLLRFEIEPTPGNGGCTLTPGYWKTHSFYGPAPYDDNWENLGDKDGDGILEYWDETFFESGKTYYQVLWTSPRGNVYYNLSFHYIAAELNNLNGADFSAAENAFEDATLLFDTYTPAYIATLKGNNPIRQQFISFAGILGDYNEGIIGPGHCEE